MITHFLFCFLVASLRNKHHCIIKPICVGFFSFLVHHLSLPAPWMVFLFLRLLLIVYKWDPETPHHSSFFPYVNSLRMLISHASSSSCSCSLFCSVLLFSCSASVVCTFARAYIQGITRLSPLTDGLSCMCCMCAPFIFLSSFFPSSFSVLHFFPFFSPFCRFPLFLQFLDIYLISLWFPVAPAFLRTVLILATFFRFLSCSSHLFATNRCERDWCRISSNTYWMFAFCNIASINQRCADIRLTNLQIKMQKGAKKEPNIKWVFPLSVL